MRSTRCTRCEQRDCTVVVPIGTLDAVTEQPNEILVPDAADCFNLHLELPLSLAPGEAGEGMEIYISTKAIQSWKAVHGLY
jgi:hypothetical protein